MIGLQDMTDVNGLQIQSTINHPDNQDLKEAKKRVEEVERRAEEEKKRADDLERQLAELKAQLAQSEGKALA